MQHVDNWLAGRLAKMDPDEENCTDMFCSGCSTSLTVNRGWGGVLIAHEQDGSITEEASRFIWCGVECAKVWVDERLAEMKEECRRGHVDLYEGDECPECMFELILEED